MSHAEYILNLIHDRILLSHAEYRPSYILSLEIVNRLHEENRLDNSDYSAVHDGLSEIEPLRDRDEALEELWEQFGDIPMNPETECIEVPFMGWGVGIHREEIWHWFDVRHSKGVAYLLYGSSVSHR